MPVNNSNNDLAQKILVETIISGLESARKGISESNDSIRLMQLDQVKVKSDVENIKKNVDELLKIVRDEGTNGKKSILMRLSDIEDFKEDIEKKEEKEEKIHSENVKGKWAIKVALASGILGMIAAILQHFIK